MVDVDECRLMDLCKNNGTCINNNGSYACNCTDGWQGQHCELGKSLSEGLSIFRQIRPFFIYLYVMILFFLADANECEMLGLCHHNGTCINNNGSYVCDCTHGWQGQHCEDGVYKFEIVSSKFCFTYILRTYGICNYVILFTIQT